MAAGIVFCALAALGSSQAPSVEAMANSFLPYVAVPLASGLLVRRFPRSYAAWAAAYGAVSSLGLVLAFYAANAAMSPYGLSTWGPLFYSGAAVVAGGSLGLFSWWIQPQAFRNKRAWGAICCLLLAAGQLAVILGPSRYTPADFVGLLFVLIFCCALNLIALRIGAASANHQRAERKTSGTTF